MSMVMKGREIPSAPRGVGGLTMYAVATLVPHTSNTIVPISSSFTRLVHPFFTCVSYLPLYFH